MSCVLLIVLGARAAEDPLAVALVERFDFVVHAHALGPLGALAARLVDRDGATTATIRGWRRHGQKIHHHITRVGPFHPDTRAAIRRGASVCAYEAGQRGRMPTKRVREGDARACLTRIEHTTLFWGKLDLDLRT